MSAAEKSDWTNQMVVKDLAVNIELQQFDEIVGLIYNGPLEEIPWDQSLRWLQKKLGANHVTLIIRPPTAGAAGMMIYTGTPVTNMEAAYQNYYFAFDPFIGLPEDRVVTVDEFVPSQDWLESPYYQQYMKPIDVFHLLGADFRLPDGGEGRFRVTRPESAPAFTEDDKQICNILLRHFKQAMILHSHIGRVESVSKLYAETVNRLMVGAIIVDENGKILQSNHAAEEILESSDGIRRVGGNLEARYLPENRQLQRMIKAAVSLSVQSEPSISEAMSVTRPSGKCSLGVVVRSIPVNEWAESGRRAAAAIFIRDPEAGSRAPYEVVRQLFNLTPSETALAMELVNGLSLDEAAEKLGVKRNTARAHLRAIFSKTGVTRQSELVRMLLNSVVSLGMSDA